MNKTPKTSNSTKVNLTVDIVIFIAFLITTAPQFSGIPVHEWLSLAFGAAAIVHLLLHWQWIAHSTRRLFGKLARQSRINYILNTLLFIDVTIIMFTGIMISRAALPALGISVAPNFSWRLLHSLTSDFGVILLGFHIALHWQWILNALKKYVLAPLTRRPVSGAVGMTKSTPPTVTAAKVSSADVAA